MGRLGQCCAILLLAVCLPCISCFRNFEYCKGTSWIKFEGNCYSFQSPNGKRLSYYDAEDYCRSHGAHLASVHSAEEDAFIFRTLQEGGFGGRLWIGLDILAGNQTPHWSDGSNVNYQNRIHKDFYINEKCFIMFSSGKGWRPEHCALHYVPICKRPEGDAPTPVPPVTTPAPPQGHCPEGWLQMEQKCYKYFGKKEEDRLDHKQARNACWALGKNHDLVSIHSYKEQAFLTQNLYLADTSPWIGMRMVESDEIGHDLVFGWIDNSRTDFTFWARGHPPPGTWKYCGRLSYEGVAKGEWIADYCEIGKKAYICQRPADPDLPAPRPEKSECNTDEVAYRESCYRYVSAPMTQTDAEATCLRAGGHAVSITDSLEQAFVYGLASDKNADFWMGLKVVEGTRYLRWIDQDPLYYSNWADEPFRVKVEQNSCGYMVANRDFKWNMTSCTRKLPFVCEIELEEPPKFTEVIGRCPSGESSWIDIGDEFCYHVPDAPGSVQSWDATSRYCLLKGMKMTKINSTHQANSLLSYLWTESYGVHIGLLKTFDKKSFVWVDGSPMVYANWDDKEPSSYPGTKECVAFSQATGKWRTVNCNDAGVVLCQAPKIKNTA